MAVGLSIKNVMEKIASFEGKFRQWRGDKITAFELNDFIHEFHNGISRNLWSFYTRGHIELIVAQAIENSIILKTEINSRILEKLIR